MTSFDDIRKKRLLLVDALRENDAEDGLRGLLTELYPDNAHFIYELLQNAEDAHARQVIFTVEPDRVTVEHNGTREFDLADVQSITNIGKSTKKDDQTQIGKFGIGFKAVFAYTATPEIHSKAFSFIIRDLIVPEAITTTPSTGWTRFVFPFNNPTKATNRAVAEVAQGLLDLDDTTLLFLTHIASVMFLLPDGSNGVLEREEKADGVIAIRRESDNIQTESHWLRLMHTTTVTLDSGESYPTPVAAAFSLAPIEAPTSKNPPTAERNERQGDQWQVQPLDEGQVCIYFPAVNESSGLRFHVNAPFASTVARDSVSTVVQNDALLDAIAQMVADALPRLSKDGFLTDGLLATIPNAKDVLPARYDVIRRRVRDSFYEHPITPVHGGGFARADELHASPTGLRRLGKDDLAIVAGDERRLGDDARTIRWIANRDGLAGAFLAGLAVTTYDWTDLASDLEGFQYYLDLDADECDEDDVAIRKSWDDWLVNKDDKRLRQLYATLGEGALAEPHRFDFLSEIRIIRVGGKRRRHVLGGEAFLPTSPNAKAGTSLVPAGLAPFDDDDDPQLRTMQRFFRAAGVRRWDDTAKIGARLDRYRSPQPATVDDANEGHFRDLREFMRYFDASGSAHTFARVPFLLSVRSGRLRWSTPADVYLDIPFVDTGFEEIEGTAAMPRGLLWPGYLDRVPEVAAFAVAVGAKGGVEIEAFTGVNQQFSRFWWNEGRTSDYTVKEDWFIPEFDAAVDAGAERLLRCVYERLRGADKKYARGRFRVNRSSDWHFYDTELAQRLRSTAWIPDLDGGLRTPESMTTRELAAGLIPPVDGDLLSAIGFAREEAAEQAEMKKKEETAQGEGFSNYREMLVAKEFAQHFSVEEMEELLARRISNGFPSDASDAPERRAQFAYEAALDAPDRQTDIRSRSVSVGFSEHREAARAYLRARYTHKGRLHCQACHEPMPFQVDGQDYFEAVRFVRSLRAEHPEARLALCPNCAAMYAHARTTDDAELRRVFLAVDAGTDSDQFSIPLVLANRAVGLWFGHKHFIDLGAVLRADHP